MDCRNTVWDLEVGDGAAAILAAWISEGANRMDLGGDDVQPRQTRARTSTTARPIRKTRRILGNLANPGALRAHLFRRDGRQLSHAMELPQQAARNHPRKPAGSEISNNHVH